MLRKKAGEIMNTRVCSVSFYTLRYIDLQSFNRKTTITHNNFRHCRVMFSLFVTQPFSKKLYILTAQAWSIILYGSRGNFACGTAGTLERGRPLGEPMTAQDLIHLARPPG